MHPLQQCLFICGIDERVNYQARGISHLITVTNPGAMTSSPSWFQGTHLELRFGDVISEADAKRCQTVAPSIEDIHRALSFGREALTVSGSRMLVSCDYGASRSPALAYLLAADQLDQGKEAEALSLILAIRPNAVPNSLIVKLGDKTLNRNGALITPLKDLYGKINSLLFPKES